MIAATAYRFPTAFQTVDIAVVNDKGELLLARKPDEKKWRFIGGFSDPNSKSLEEDAKREVIEESGVEVGNITYLGSTIINDWRYRGEIDKIKTAFFVAKYTYGKPEGADDVAEVKWVPIGRVPINNLMKNDIVEGHHVLVDIFNEKFVSNPKLMEEFIQPEIDGNMP
jgi:bifunctional NMN adenylyltransferase/nudix hydrolase